MKPFKTHLNNRVIPSSQTIWAINEDELEDPSMLQIKMYEETDQNTISLKKWKSSAPNNVIKANYYCITHKKKTGMFGGKSDINKVPFLNYLHLLLTKS